MIYSKGMLSKLLIWIVLGLLPANAQCVAYCSVFACDSHPSDPASPPCHQHHHGSQPAKVSGCPHHTAIAPAPAAAPIAAPASAAHTIPPPAWFFSGQVAPGRAAGWPPPSLMLVLRI